MSLSLLSLIVVYFLVSYKLLISRSYSEFLLKVLFLYVFLFGILEYFGLSEFIRKFMIDILIILLLIVQINKAKYKFPGLRWFIALSTLIFSSSAFSLSALYPSFTYYRTFLYPFIVFVIVYNIKMCESDWLIFNKFIFSLFILQIAASVIKLIFIGVSEKLMIGTISTSGGVFSTMLPLSAVAFIFSFFMIYRQDLKYILLVTGFLFIGYMGAKRGIWIYTPIILISGIYFYIRITSSFERKKISKKLMRLTIFIIIFSAITLIFGAKYTRSLNPENIKGGQFDINYLQEYAVEYTFATSENEQYTLGRGANFLSVMRQMLNAQPINSLFGYGPESGKGVRTYGEGIWEYLGVNGPITGLTYHLVQIGLIGTTILLLILLRIAIFFFRIARKERQKYWKSFIFGTFMIFIVLIADLFTYSNAFITTIFPMSFTLAYLSALVLKRSTFQKLSKTDDIRHSAVGNDRYTFF